MKRLLSLLLFSLIFTSPTVHAAPKKIDVKPMQLVTTIASPAEVGGVVISGKSIIIYGTKDFKAYARAIDISGKEVWNVSLDQSPASIATAAAVDSSGDIWITGSTPLTTGIVAPTPTVTTINPDNTVIPPDTFISDLRAISLWKVSQEGVLISTKTLPTSYVLLPTSIAVDKNGATIVGITATDNGNAGFATNVEFDGNFSKLVQIGFASTTADAVVRQRDGSITIAGSSAETLGGKKLAGVIDGVLVKLSKSLKIISVVRSSLAKGKRNWNSASASLLLGGEAIVGAKTESAVTKFSNTLVPQWSYRFASAGSTTTLAATQAAFISTASIAQLNWNPKNATILVLTFDSKGAIVAADSAPSSQKEVIALLKSKDLGVLLVTSSAELLSIFTPVSR